MIDRNQLSTGEDHASRENLTGLEIVIPDTYAQIWSQEIAELIRRSIDQRAKQGYSHGLAPLGYLNTARRYDNHIVLDDTRAPLVRQAFHMSGKDKSLREVLEIITRKGLTSRKGQPLTAFSLYKILTNPFYTGKFRHNGELLLGNHPPLVSADLFNRVQANLRGS